MMHLKAIFVSLIWILFFVLSCGKKLPPTSPDIWPPKVLNVNPIDRHHIVVYFSERVDTITSQKLINFKILNPERSETTGVIFSERKSKGDEVLLTIPELGNDKYTLFVYNIKDIKGNLMKNAEKSFKPSSEKDTIPPLLKYSRPSRMWIRAPMDSIILLKFSEPMDSSSADLDNFILTNVLIDSGFVWSKTLTQLRLGFHLKEATVGKVFILPVLSDLSGNRLEEMRILTLTAMDSLPKNRMNINVGKENELRTKGYAFLRSRTKKLLENITVVDTACSFFFMPEDTYFVSVIAKDSVDTTGVWWGEKKIGFFPDTTGVLNEKISLDYIKKDKIDHFVLSTYDVLLGSIK